MRKSFFLLSIAFLVVTSCSKWDGKKHKDSFVYYCDTYKEKDIEVLGVHTSDIEALWTEYWKKDGKTEYALIVKSNGEFYKELGTYSFNGETGISFMPNGGNEYNGSWVEYKDKYSITVENDERSEDLLFIYKETCGKDFKK
jgi:hypothetical protein